jgi:hypothetical protein
MIAFRSVFVVTLVCLILKCDGFSTTLNQIPRANKLGFVSLNRPRRSVPKASLALDQYDIMAKATNLLLALEEESTAEAVHAIKGIHLYASKVLKAKV